MNIRKGVASMAVAVAATMGVLVAPGTANASSGGGCDIYSDGGNDLESCISASGKYLEPDGYIIRNTGCVHAYLALENAANGSVLATHSVGCSLGHKGPFPYLGTNGQQYQTELWTEDSNGYRIDDIWSWTETFSD